MITVIVQVMNRDLISTLSEESVETHQILGSLILTTKIVIISSQNS